MEQIEHLPPALAAIEAATAAHGFTMPSDRATGSLLRTLAAAKGDGRLLELGTGTGLATAWMLDGLGVTGRLHSVDNDVTVQAIARAHLGSDPRVHFETADGAAVIRRLLADQARFDLVFADAWPGKFSRLDETLALLKPGGFYVVDDLLPQPNWPADHPPKAARFIATMGNRPDVHVTKLAWSTGIILATRRA